MAHKMIQLRMCIPPALVGLFFTPILAYIAVLSSVNIAEAASGRDIVIIDSPGSPAWKSLWDKARELARQKKYSLSAASYAELIAAKPHIDEAKWEYCKVLVELKDWLSASDLLESLLETDSDRSDYLQMAGMVALKNKEFKRAVDYFGRVYGTDPAGPLAVDSLKGLIAGLQGLGRKSMAFPLMEQLYLRTPRDPQLLQDLAGYAHELGDLQKARYYYLELVDRPTTEENVFLRASELFESTGTEKEALAIWEGFLKKQPGYLPFHKKIADYYMQIGKSQSALSHILYMIDNDVEDESLLLVAGRIFLENEGRPDKALHYFEKYAEKHPEDIAIQVEIKRIQKVLANDFLSIVENDGAWILWRDLVQVTPNRLAIYREMADQLEKKKRNKELLSVLQIIHHHHPEDESNILRIAELNYKLKNYADSLKFLKKIKGEAAREYKYVLLRAKVEDRLGMDLDALRLYEIVLQIRPDNHVVRLRGMKLAARLGLIESLQKIFAESSVEQGARQKFELKLQYAEGLQENGKLSEATVIHEELLSENRSSPDLQAKILFNKADGLLEAGYFYQAEQTLREMLAHSMAVNAVLVRLVKLSLVNNDLGMAKDWFSILTKKSQDNNWRDCKTPLDRKIFKLYLDILAKEELLDDVVKEIEGFLRKKPAENTRNDMQSLVLELQIALSRVYLQQNKNDQCLRLLTQLREKQANNLDIALIWFQLSKNQGKSVSAFGEIDQSLEAGYGISLVRTIDSARLALKNQEFALGLHQIEKMLNVLPESITARILKAKLLTTNGDLAQALKIYQELLAEVGEQEHFKRQILEIEFRQGNFDRVVQESKASTFPDMVDNAEGTGGQVEPEYWRKLMLARALWVEKQWDASFKIYEMLLANPVQREFQTAITQEKIEVFVPPLKKSIWNMLSFASPETQDSIAYYMRPEFVGGHIGQPIDKITARIYEKYRWQKLIRNEYLARKALQAKDIHVAEKQFKKLVEEDSDIEGLYDLARVYGRLGDYGKEAELYQVIRKYGPIYPELSASIAQNELRRKPRLSADFEFFEKKGREGHIDIANTIQGAGAWFMPNLDKEVSLKYQRNAYSNSDSETKLRGNNFIASYSQSLNQKTDLFISLGGETLDDYDDTLLAGLEITRNLDENIKGYIAFHQDNVNDTLAALESGIYSQDWEGGLIFDPAGGTVFGGEYRRRLYSDDNDQNQFHIWSAYTIYNESNTYEVRYNYKLLQNSNVNSNIIENEVLVDSPATIPYWSPGEYWEHSATFHFQHLLKNFSLLKETPSFYAIDYSLGYESGENIVNKLGFEIFLEMTPHFLLKGGVSYSTSEDNDQKGASISLIYRW